MLIKGGLIKGRLTNRPSKNGVSRRDMLCLCFNGLGSLALADLLMSDVAQAAVSLNNPLAPKKPNFPPKVKNVIFLFMSGGVSQVDTFDYKPALAKIAGQRLPHMAGLEGELEAFLKQPHAALPNVYPFQQAGKNGRQLSTLFKHFGSVIDDVAFVHGIKVYSNNHAPATMH